MNEKLKRLCELKKEEHKIRWENIEIKEEIEKEIKEIISDKFEWFDVDDEGKGVLLDLNTNTLKIEELNKLADYFGSEVFLADINTQKDDFCLFFYTKKD